MATDPKATPASASPASPVADASPQGHAATVPHPLPDGAAESEAAPTSSPSHPTRAEWVRIAIFGIPYATFFLVGVPTWIFPASWSLTAINIGLDTILLIMALAFFGREFFPAFTYLRTRPVRKIALLFGLWFLVTAIQAASRIALYGHNQPIAENQQQVMNALNDGTLGLVFTFFVGIGVPVIEEMFFRHILIGKLSAYAPTWLVASISAALFAYMHSHQWQDFFMYLPLSIVLTLVYVMSGKNVAYSWLFHALNNSIMLIVRAII
ncbi:MAG: CPBP family glutamic-type intramembrane protease [Actinomyces sp.]|nr:CPBP family glutamic-type intramembrane protease [Actinomyces sp.]